ncbi:MAG: 5-formyltetrahydrofolate cyclo-ligase [Pseudomonadota bacterium]
MSYVINAKRAVRSGAYKRRADQPNKAALSARITDAVRALSEYRAAKTIAWYMHIRSEVQTHAVVAEELISAELSSAQLRPAELSKRCAIVLPQCEPKHLNFWSIAHPDEVAPGRWGIPEPSPAVQADPKRRVAPGDIDFVVVPGVAFTTQGERLGNGAGYYDRFLNQTDALRVAVAFESQIVDSLPLEPTDLPVHLLVTELRIIRIR